MTPPYVSAKVGIDAATEIIEGELFDFDAEVQPILETLIGRTLQQALTEVIHEEEIAELREQQQKMLASREAEMAELRRLEQQEDRLQGEKVWSLVFRGFRSANSLSSKGSSWRRRRYGRSARSPNARARDCC